MPFSPFRRGGRRPSPAAPCFRPLLLCLEERLTPGRFVVSDLGDSVPSKFGTFRFAVEQLNLRGDANNTLEVKAGLKGNILLVAALDPIQKNVDITGKNVNLVRSQAAGIPAFRILQINAGVTVTITDLNLRKGTSATDGGNIYNEGTLTLNDCLVVGGTAAQGGGIYNRGDLTVDKRTGIAINTSTGAGGGGIYNADVGTLRLNGCLLDTNEANNAMTSADGGGLYNAGRATISAGTFVGLNDADGRGGGIFNQTDATLTVSGSTIKRNRANEGAGIYNVSTNAAGLTVTSCLVYANGTVANPAFQAGPGGGIYNEGPATVTNSIITANVAPRGAGIYDKANRVVLRNTTDVLNVPTALLVPGPAAPAAGVPGDDLYLSGGGLYVESGGEADAVNTLIAGNRPADGSVVPDVVGLVNSAGHNLVGVLDGTLSSGWSGSDLAGTPGAPLDPLLDSLGDFGGPTQSIPLLPGSPASARPTPVVPRPPTSAASPAGPPPASARSSTWPAEPPSSRSAPRPWSRPASRSR